MIDFLSLFKSTDAYKIIKAEKEADRLSHAYLLVCGDGENYIEYLKIIAKIIACKDGAPCGECRCCRLIDGGMYPDLTIYPAGDIVLSADANDLIEQSYIKPIEGANKIFIINRGETMNGSVQNKLLKTIEEPPKNVHVIIGAITESAILPTVKSRVRKLEIPPFSDKTLYAALKEEYSDEERLKEAIACGDGTVGAAQKNYNDEKFKKTVDVVAETITGLTSSKKLLYYSNKICTLNQPVEEVLSVMEQLFTDMLYNLSGKSELVRNANRIKTLSSADGFNRGAVINALDKITEAKKRKSFNATDQSVTEWLLFQILEGKFKWRKF